MISDRHYMRESSPAKELAPLLWLIGALVLGFIVQRVLDGIWPHFTDRWLALSADNILHGRLWVLFTYSFLHEPKDLWHLIGNSLGILFIGRMLLPSVGRNRLLLAYAAAVVAAGIFWLAVNFTYGTPLIGASGGVYGLLALFCCQFAYERMTMLLFFMIPVTIVPRYLLMVVGGVTTLLFLFAELFPVGARSPIAHSAHLAGLIAGIIAFRAMRQKDDTEERATPDHAIELPAWMRKKLAPDPSESPKVSAPSRLDLKAEVDRILDKINTSGFGSLTAEEKRTLDDARNLMSKR